jgi:hypothetical protein
MNHKTRRLVDHNAIGVFIKYDDFFEYFVCGIAHMNNIR